MAQSIQQDLTHNPWKNELLTPCGSGDIETQDKEIYGLRRNYQNGCNFFILYFELKTVTDSEPTGSLVSKYI